MFDWYFLSQNLNITLTINVFSYSLFIGKAGLERQEWRQQFMYFLPWRESMINYAVRCTVRWRSLAALCLDLRSDVTLLAHWSTGRILDDPDTRDVSFWLTDIRHCLPWWRHSWSRRTEQSRARCGPNQRAGQQTIIQSGLSGLSDNNTARLEGGPPSPSPVF